MPSKRGKLTKCPNCDYVWHRRIYRAGKRCPRCNVWIGEMLESEKVAYARWIDKTKIKIQKKFIESPESPAIAKPPPAMPFVNNSIKKGVPKTSEEAEKTLKLMKDYYGIRKTKSKR